MFTSIFLTAFYSFLRSLFVFYISIMLSICTNSQESKGLRKNMYMYSKLTKLESIFTNNVSLSKCNIFHH